MFELHRAAILQYNRPETIGLVFGAFLITLFFKEFRPRGVSSFVRFFLGVFAAIGALFFIGCPWKVWLRLSGGVLSAVAGIVGLFARVCIGTMILKRGFSLGRSKDVSKFEGYLMAILWWLY